MSKYTITALDNMIKEYDRANETLANAKNDVDERKAELLAAMDALGFERREVPELMIAGVVQTTTRRTLDTAKLADWLKDKGLEIPEEFYKVTESTFFKTVSAKKAKGDIRKAKGEAAA